MRDCHARVTGFLSAVFPGKRPVDASSARHCFARGKERDRDREREERFAVKIMNFSIFGVVNGCLVSIQSEGSKKSESI